MLDLFNPPPEFLSIDRLLKKGDYCESTMQCVHQVPRKRLTAMITCPPLRRSPLPPKISHGTHLSPQVRLVAGEHRRRYLRSISQPRIRIRAHDLGRRRPDEESPRQIGVGCGFVELPAWIQRAQLRTSGKIRNTAHHFLKHAHAHRKS